MRPHAALPPKVGRAVMLVTALSLLVAGCLRREPPPPPTPTTVEQERLSEPPAVSEVVRRPVSPSGDDPTSVPASSIVPAVSQDEAYGGTEPSPARRLVYRVTLRLPGGFGHPPPTLPVHAAELFIDVSDERLRARFVGPGWPVAPGSEVRLRKDLPGVYIFDPQGGRPLPPGALATWFQGGEIPKSHLPLVSVRGPGPADRVGPGNLLCALFAEWSGHEREALSRRCGENGTALKFRVGPWWGERTADVSVDLPRSSLRADHIGAPRPIPAADTRAFMEPATLARIQPRRRPRGEPAADAPAEGIRVENRSHTRIVVAIQGVPVGWINAGVTGYFVGLRSGTHRVAALRPLGTVAYRTRDLGIPLTLSVR